MDNFTEQLVKKSETSAAKRRRVMLLLSGITVTVMLTLLSFIQLNRPVLALLGMILAVAAGYGTYNMFQGTFIEYEYTFTNGELDIAKIIAKKKRSEMLSVEVRTFTAFGKYNDDLEETEDMTVVFSSDNIASHEYYADFTHKDYGLTRLVFVPNEKMLEYITRYLPAKLKRQNDQ